MIKINLVEYFENTVRKHADKIAVYDKERDITFSGLEQKCKLFASEILSRKNVIKRPIAIYLNKSIESVYSDLAVIYSGNFYMNLDVKTPVTRIKNILELVCPEVIITNNQFEKNIQDIVPKETVVINLDSVDFGEIVRDDNMLSARLGTLIDTDPLCIINTSGSTGTPKGVVLNHRSFVDFTEWADDTFSFTDEEIIGSLSPLVFDIYSFELCMLMAKGSHGL